MFLPVLPLPSKMIPQPRSATSELVRRSRGRSLPSTQTGSRRSRAHPGHLYDNHALGTAHAFAHVTAKTDLAIGAPARSVCTAAAVASLRARFSHSCGINVSLASLGRCARTCERYHGLFSPGSRPTASSQTLSASPTGLDSGKVGVRAHGAWDHEVFARDSGWSVFQCVAVPLVAQKSQMVAQKSQMVAQKSHNGRQPGSACRWPQVFDTQAIRLRPMTLFNPVFNFLTP